MRYKPPLAQGVLALSKSGNETAMRCAEPHRRRKKKKSPMEARVC